MKIKNISVTKSRTFGTQVNSASIKFNKIVVTMEAEVEKDELIGIAYKNLSNQVDSAIDYEIEKLKATAKPANKLNSLK